MYERAAHACLELHTGTNAPFSGTGNYAIVQVVQLRGVSEPHLR